LIGARVFLGIAALPPARRIDHTVTVPPVWNRLESVLVLWPHRAPHAATADRTSAADRSDAVRRRTLLDLLAPPAPRSSHALLQLRCVLATVAGERSLICVDSSCASGCLSHLTACQVASSREVCAICALCRIDLIHIGTVRMYVYFQSAEVVILGVTRDEGGKPVDNAASR